MGTPYNRVGFTTATTGTGTVTVGSALPNCRTPVQASIPDGTVVSYSIHDGSAAYEDGQGTIGGSGTTLARTTISDSSNGGSAVNLSGAANVRITVLAADMIEKLTAPRLTANLSLYVATTGSDSNNGLAVGTPFLTIQKAVDTAKAYDFNGFNITINVANGTYAGNTTIAGPWLQKGGTLFVTGNITTPANVIWQGDQVVSGPIKVHFTSKALTASGAGCYVLLNKVNFGVAFVQPCWQVYVTDRANVEVIGDYVITSNCDYHVGVYLHGRFTAQSRTINDSGRGFIAFLIIDRRAFADFSGSTFTLVGGEYGKRYQATIGSLIYTGGGGANFFPGDNAGTVDATSQYA
jgi:hypothetical protein